MGKHNGKARKSGLSVGGALVNRAKREGRTNPATAHMHTTDLGGGNNLQSVLESRDLDELMSMVVEGRGGRQCVGAREQMRIPPRRGGCRRLAPAHASGAHATRGGAAVQLLAPSAPTRLPAPLPRVKWLLVPPTDLPACSLHRPRWRGATSALRSSR